MQATAREDKDDPYGWVMVFVGFTLMSLSFGGLGAVGVFLKPIAMEFGWSRGSIALGYTTAAFSAALFGMLWGFLADRHPTRYFTLMGALAIAIAMLALSRLTAQWQYYLSFFIFGAFGHGALASTIWANIGQWFTRNMGLALGIGLAGGAFGQAVVPLAARFLISAYDWRTAYLVLGAVYLLLGLTIAALTRDPPAKRARLAASSGAEAKGGSWHLGEARHPVTWFSIAVIFCCTCMSLAVVHIVPMLSDRGFSPEIAAGALATLMLVGVLGRMGAGKICDLIGPVRTYALMSAGQTLLVIWFPHIESLFGVYLLAALFGFSFSGVMASMVISVNVVVPPRVAARAWSIVSFFAWIGMGTGSYMGGFLFDLTGGYHWAYAFAAAMGCINLVILTLFYFSRGRQQPVLVVS
ncbi:MAG: MFS transporter [Alphaproteobacteria bacterium]|nr:MFS transporter [Alphaproteobacteria bacterium]